MPRKERIIRSDAINLRYPSCHSLIFPYLHTHTRLVRCMWGLSSVGAGLSRFGPTALATSVLMWSCTCAPVRRCPIVAAAQLCREPFFPSSRPHGRRVARPLCAPIGGAVADWAPPHDCHQAVVFVVASGDIGGAVGLDATAETMLMMTARALDNSSWRLRRTLAAACRPLRRLCSPVPPNAPA